MNVLINPRRHIFLSVRGNKNTKNENAGIKKKKKKKKKKKLEERVREEKDDF